MQTVRSTYGAGGAEPDPSLVILDEGADADSRAPETSRKASTPDHRVIDEFDLAALELSAPSAPDARDIGAASTPATRNRKRHRHSKRRRPAPRTAIVAIGAGMVIACVVVMLILSGSCVR